MNEADKIRQGLVDMHDDATRRLEQAQKAKKLKGHGNEMIDVASDEISALVSRAVNRRAPLSQEEYLNVHGRIQGIQWVIDMVNNASDREQDILREIEGINEQIKSITPAEPAQPGE